MSDFLKLVGERIRTLRKAKGWTQEDLAEKANINNSYFGGIERGDRNISLETLDKVIKALDVAPSEILHFKEIEVDNEVMDKKQLLEIHKSLLIDRNIEEIKLVHKTVKDIINLMDSEKN
jgi:transcriptional regulator with XRE-family HTH domain